MSFSNTAETELKITQALEKLFSIALFYIRTVGAYSLLAVTYLGTVKKAYLVLTLIAPFTFTGREWKLGTSTHQKL
jgi:hypothetical protein